MCFPLSCHLSGGCPSSQLTAFSLVKKRRVDKGSRESVFSATEGGCFISAPPMDRPLRARHWASRVQQTQLPKTETGLLSRPGRPRSLTVASQCCLPLFPEPHCRPVQVPTAPAPCQARSGRETAGETQQSRGAGSPNARALRSRSPRQPGRC